MVFVLASCIQRGSNPLLGSLPSQNPLIEMDELLTSDFSARHTLIDFRPQSAYTKGHIKGAVNIWRSELEDRTKPYTGMMPTKKQLENILSKKGIDPSDTLIIYDHNGSCEAARLWWILQHYGFNQTRILNGGWNAYLHAGLLPSKEEPHTITTAFNLKGATSEFFIDREELLTLLHANTPVKLVDVRTPEEYHGKRKKKGAHKAGRIPKSILFDWKNALDSIEGQFFLPKEALQKRFQNLSPNKEDLMVIYCHSGVRSAHTTFVLTQLLGYKNVKNYDGSWTEWSYYEQLPYVKDAETVIFE